MQLTPGVEEQKTTLCAPSKAVGAAGTDAGTEQDMHVSAAGTESDDDGWS